MHFIVLMSIVSAVPVRMWLKTNSKSYKKYYKTFLSILIGVWGFHAIISIIIKVYYDKIFYWLLSKEFKLSLLMTI